jgi:hypothetical protein
MNTVTPLLSHYFPFYQMTILVSFFSWGFDVRYYRQSIPLYYNVSGDLKRYCPQEEGFVTISL